MSHHNYHFFTVCWAEENRYSANTITGIDLSQLVHVASKIRLWWQWASCQVSECLTHHTSDMQQIPPSHLILPHFCTPSCYYCLVSSSTMHTMTTNFICLFATSQWVFWVKRNNPSWHPQLFSPQLVREKTPYKVGSTYNHMFSLWSK